jgi:hypothetical protein
MPSKYDENSEAKAVRLVREHAGEAPAHITPARRNGSLRAPAQRPNPPPHHPRAGRHLQLPPGRPYGNPG